jgi:hypothetical protein
LPAQNNQTFKPDDFSALLPVDEVLALTPAGTPAREENEFKLEIPLKNDLLRQNSYLLAKARRALERAFVNDSLWKATRHTDSAYYIMNVGQGTFCFLDIYLDDDSGLNFKNDVSYRVRYRWHSRSSLLRYLLGSNDRADFPHRCEYQLKIYENAWKDAFNNCLETRFEYRNESFPFKADTSAPPAPWPFEEFIRPAVNGRYKDFCVNTTFDYARFCKDKLKRGGVIRLKPSLIIITTRRRIHLGIKNEYGLRAAKMGFGSAVNAEQAILTTIDCSEVFSPDLLQVYEISRHALAHRSLTPRLRKRLKASIAPVGSFTEYEFEFERNIESALGREIEQAEARQEKARLQQVKADFIADVRTVSEILARTFSETGIKLIGGQMSKYRKAYRLLNPEPSVKYESRQALDSRLRVNDGITTDSSLTDR